MLPSAKAVVSKAKLPLFGVVGFAVVSLCYLSNRGDRAAAVFDTKVNVDTLTPREMFDYFLWPNRTACRLVHDFGGHVKRNPSGLDGQKAVCLDPDVAPAADSCTVYSFGINNEWSFDEAMSQYGCQVYAFDPSMNRDDFNRSPSIHFFNLGLNSVNFVSSPGWKFRTLDSIYRMLQPHHGNVSIDYLKLDIEHDEWIALPQILQSGMMDRVRQLAVEIHLPVEDTLTRLRQRTSILKAIEAYGMVRFDSKYNPWFVGQFHHFDMTRPRGYEIAWYNAKLLQ